MDIKNDTLMKSSSIALLLFLLIGFVPPAPAQVLLPGSDDYDYFRTLQLRQDSISLFYNVLEMIRYDAPTGVQHDSRGLFARRLHDNGVLILPVQTRLTWNSHLPRSRNNGAVWHGRGVTQELHGGFQARYGALDITLYPVVYFSQNRAFPLPMESGMFPTRTDHPERSTYLYPTLYNDIDYVMRFGPNSFAAFDPGQSDISLRWMNTRFGFSTQNTIAGPSWYSTILQGANAPGVPHFYIRNPRPVNIWIGEAEFRQAWGAARSSEWFGHREENGWRYYTSLSIGWLPRYTKGLYLGFNRVFLKKGSEFAFSDDLIATLWNFNSDVQEVDGFQFNDDYFQMTSVTGRWTFPEVGFEAYLEYVRNDFGGGPFGNTPEHSRAYTIGVTKIQELPDRSLFALTGEVSTNGATRTELVRVESSYYEHSIVMQGHTNRGQLMGSYIGPGAMAYNVFIRRYTETAMHGFVLDYLRHFEDFYYRNFDHPDAMDREFSLGYKGWQRFGAVDAGVTALVGWRTNRYMIVGDNFRQYHLSVSLKYNFSSR
jgi:hypothetical protein